MSFTILMRNIIFVMFFLNISSASCKEREVVETHKNLYSQKVIPCYLDYGIDFCDVRHLAAIKKAIKTKKPVFYKKFIILFIKEFKSGLSMVAIDSVTHTAYPLPFDYFGGSVDEKGFEIGAPSVGYNLNENKICIDGTVYSYRNVKENAISCYVFNGSGFDNVYDN